MTFLLEEKEKEKEKEREREREWNKRDERRKTGQERSFEKTPLVDQARRLFNIPCLEGRTLGIADVQRTGSASFQTCSRCSRLIFPFHAPSPFSLCFSFLLLRACAYYFFFHVKSRAMGRWLPSSAIVLVSDKQSGDRRVCRCYTHPYTINLIVTLIRSGEPWSHWGTNISIIVRLHRDVFTCRS